MLVRYATPFPSTMHERLCTSRSSPGRVPYAAVLKNMYEGQRPHAIEACARVTFGWNLNSASVGPHAECLSYWLLTLKGDAGCVTS